MLHKGSVDRKYLNEKLPPCQSYAQYLFEKSYNYDPFRYTCIFHIFDVCFGLINILVVFIWFFSISIELNTLWCKIHVQRSTHSPHVTLFILALHVVLRVISRIFYSQLNIFDQCCTTSLSRFSTSYTDVNINFWTTGGIFFGLCRKV